MITTPALTTCHQPQSTKDYPDHVLQNINPTRDVIYYMNVWLPVFDIVVIHILKVNVRIARLI